MILIHQYLANIDRKSRFSVHDLLRKVITVSSLVWSSSRIRRIWMGSSPILTRAQWGSSVGSIDFCQHSVAYREHHVGCWNCSASGMRSLKSNHISSVPTYILGHSCTRLHYIPILLSEKLQFHLSSSEAIENGCRYSAAGQALGATRKSSPRRRMAEIPDWPCPRTATGAPLASVQFCPFTLHFEMLSMVYITFPGDGEECERVLWN